jgi:translation initiation factor 6
MLVQGDIFGNPYIGVYCAANEKLALFPFTTPEKTIDSTRKALDIVGAMKVSIDGAHVLGALICMNSKGAVVSQFISKVELGQICSEVKVTKLPHKLNAAGNNILANDKGALVNPEYDDKTVSFISEALDVPAERGTVAGYKTVGSAAVATNKGVICHPHTDDLEKQQLERVLGVEVHIATANYGTGLLGACMIANTKGALVGGASTPIELGKIEDGLKLF